MFTCDKCGARLMDGIKYCDKCGSEVSEKSKTSIEAMGLNDIKPLEYEVSNNKKDFKSVLMNLISYLPQPMSNKGDRTALLIGQGSVIALSLVYIICFFAFMPQMCMPISIGVVASYSGDFGGMTKGACSLWMILYFVLNLYPALIAVLSFFNKKYRMTALYSSVFLFILTFFTLISWSLCEPNSIIEAIDTYQKSGSIAWFALVDSLSEVWYLKVILSLASVFGIGLDYVINNGR